MTMTLRMMIDMLGTDRLNDQIMRGGYTDEQARALVGEQWQRVVANGTVEYINSLCPWAIVGFKIEGEDDFRFVTMDIQPRPKRKPLVPDWGWTIITAITIIFLMAVLFGGNAKAEVYTHDIPQQRPEAFRAYSEGLRRAVPAAIWMEVWVGRLDGVAVPLEVSYVGNRRVLTGWVCKPHDCLSNKVFVIVDQNRMAALISVSDYRPYFVGQMTSAERSCLIRMRDSQTEVC